MDWSILDITPTKDKKAITAAYRQKLRQTNPEDDPEGFKALRAAYEEALALADREDPPPDESPVGRWMEAVAGIYQNFSARIDPAQWQELLRSDVCTALDLRPAAEGALLDFLMEHFLLPRQVWAELDRVFHFSQRLEELYESYPREFIDHAILNGLRLEPSLPYELFTPGLDGAACDAYRMLYHEALHLPIPKLGPILEQLEALSEQHPYGHGLRCRFWLETGKPNEGTEGLRKLAADYPENAHVTLQLAEACAASGDLQEAESLILKILDREPTHVSAKHLLARCLAQQGHYHDAKELLYELMHACGGDPVVLDQYADQMKVWNETLIPEREARFLACPQDTDNAIELAWCYAQNERLEDAMELALKLDPEGADPFSYHNLMAKLHHNRSEAAEALEHLKIVEQILRELRPDGTKETAKRIDRLPEMIQLQGNCLMQLQETEAARQKFEEALRLAPEDPEVLNLMGKILFMTGDYPYAIEILERLIHILPNAWHGKMLLALSLYRLRRDQEAFDVVQRALMAHGHDLNMYVLKLQILIRNEVWEEVHAVLDLMEESGAPEDISIDFIKAQLTELEAKDPQTAFQQYQKIARRVEAGEGLMAAAELYYRMALLMGEQMDIEDEEDRQILIAQLDKGLTYDPQDMDCLSYKAWILRQGGKLQEAIQMYQEMEAKLPHPVVAQRGLSALYYENLELYAKEALHYYEQLLQNQQTSELYFYAASAKRQLGDLEGARRYHLTQLEMAPDDVEALQGLAYICDAQGDYEASLAWLDQAIAAVRSSKGGDIALVRHKAQVLRRQGKYQQALDLVDDAMKRQRYDGGYQLKFDICCQFGLWDQAQQVLDDWKSALKNDPDLMAATGQLHLLTGKMFKAVLAMGPAKHKLPFEQVQSFRLQLAELECNYPRQLQILGRRAAMDPSDDYVLMALATALWHSGQKDAARTVAEKALARLDDVLSQDLTEEALFRGRRCVVLALLGRADEARTELEKTRSLPLCHHCEYGRCKDADIYEAAIEEILGDKEKALGLYRAGRTNWPDDLDFAAGEARLGRKGKTRC